MNRDTRKTRRQEEHKKERASAHNITALQKSLQLSENEREKNKKITALSFVRVVG